jgi:hypothetical protein
VIRIKIVWGVGYGVPSAPVASTMAFTFFANSLLVLTVVEALEKPVSPQPPIAIMIFVPSANLERTSFTVVKRGHSETSFWLKIDDCINAIATCVTSDTISSSGTFWCCLNREHDERGFFD